MRSLHVGLGTLLAVGIACVTPAWGVSIQEERELGSKFALAARIQLPLLDDPLVVAYVDRIGQRMVAALEDSFFQYHFHVLRDARINAFAVPGGYVYVNSGLLTRVESDDELAAVLGHEIAHIHAHHLARQQQASQLMNYATLLGTVLSVFQPAIGAVATAANAAAQLRYNREFEQEADYMGVRFARAGGYDPRGMVDFLQKLRDEQRLNPSTVPPYLLSHPLTDERLDRLDATLQRHARPGNGERRKPLALRHIQVVTRVLSEPAGEVLSAYRAALDSKPSDVESRYLFGVACLETGQTEPARSALEAAEAAAVPGAARDLGRLALRMRQLEEARRLLSKAATADPTDAVAHAELGKALEALGDPASAMQEYRRALELAPTYAPVHHTLGILAGREGQEAEGFYHLAMALYLRGDYPEALNHFERAARLLPAGDRRSEEVRHLMEELSDFLRVAKHGDRGQGANRLDQ